MCFTETPTYQIKAILKPLRKRLYCPKPYGLVFTKEFIRENGGNPVFYMTQNIVSPLKKLYARQKTSKNTAECKLLALTTICDKHNDWHWEREWRVVKDLVFEYKNVYCGICPEEDISEFQNIYSPIKFIDPYWSKKKILDEFVKNNPPTLAPDDLPFYFLLMQKAVYVLAVDI